MVYSEKGGIQMGDGSWGEQGGEHSPCWERTKGWGASRATQLFGVRVELEIFDYEQSRNGLPGMEVAQSQISY